MTRARIEYPSPDIIGRAASQTTIEAEEEAARNSINFESAASLMAPTFPDVCQSPVLFSGRSSSKLNFRGCRHTRPKTRATCSDAG